MFRVGAHANAFYVLLEGSVAIQQRDTSTDHARACPADLLASSLAVSDALLHYLSQYMMVYVLQ